MSPFLSPFSKGIIGDFIKHIIYGLLKNPLELPFAKGENNGSFFKIASVSCAF
jgi:hypothetical protein